MKSVSFLGRFAVVIAAATGPLAAAEPRVELTIEVPPALIEGRPGDQMPARLDVNFDKLLKQAGAPAGARVDFDTLRIIPAGGEGKQPIAFRWYDADIPEQFPEVPKTIVQNAGELKPVPARMAGHFYNVSGSGRNGFLAFNHHQTGSSAGKYTVSFSLMSNDAPARGNGPRGWLGDGMARTLPTSESTTGSGHTRIDLDDWNADGLIDIIHGEEYGTLFLIPNSGSKTEPKFVHRELIRDAGGNPIDVGMHAAPYVVDFDDDGVRDLLVGTYTDRLVWFKNTGSNTDRKLVYKGFVNTSDGKPFSLPHRPIAGPSESVFKHDYYPIMQQVDWNGDGRVDYLAGGYVTGRIFLSLNEGKNTDGTPKLGTATPLEINGQPINVGDWCASPTLADFNGDGVIDLISGAQPMSPASKAAGLAMRYYVGSGSNSNPVLSEQPFPSVKPVTIGGLTTPRAADMNGDGLIDLVVSARANIWFWPNRGTKTSPKFDATEKFIQLPWSAAPITPLQFVDYNRDGKPDLFTRSYTVELNSGAPSPFEFDKTIALLPRGQRIAHPSNIGDDWFLPYLVDFDGDGDFDILFGDWFGHVWLHRNDGTHEKPDYDIEGFKLKHADGSEIKVGPIGKDINTDFQAMQGARTVIAAADLDGDGLQDLVLGDTYGIARAFRNTGTAAGPVFSPAVEVGTVKTRCSVDTTDFDGDGKRDIFVGSAGGMVRVFKNVSDGSTLKFAEGIDPKLPPIKQPRVMMVDLNGDGDEDIFVPGTQGAIWIERSFLDRGYAKARLLGVEVKK